MSEKIQNLLKHFEVKHSEPEPCTAKCMPYKNLTEGIEKIVAEEVEAFAERLKKDAPSLHGLGYVYGEHTERAISLEMVDQALSRYRKGEL